MGSRLIRKAFGKTDKPTLARYMRKPTGNKAFKAKTLLRRIKGADRSNDKKLERLYKRLS